MSNDSPAYLNGEFMQLSRVRVSPLDRGFLFGDGIYEVIPVYGRNFLDLDGHLDRLVESLKGILLNNPHTHSQWREIFQQLVDNESAIDKKVYVQITRGVQEVRNHDFIGDEIATVFAMCSAQSPLSDEDLSHGVAMYTEQEIRWSRCHLKATSLLPNVLLKHESLKKGGAETLIVKDGRVIEGSSSNVFAVIDGVVHTPLTGTEILPGITRNLLIKQAGELSLQVVEGDMTLESVKAADEVWISSSTRGVVAVTSIDGEAISDGLPGAVWQRMYAGYQKMIDELRNG